MRRSHASVSPHNFSALSHISAITFWNVFKNSAGVFEAKFFLRDCLTLLIILWVGFCLVACRSCVGKVMISDNMWLVTTVSDLFYMLLIEHGRNLEGRFFSQKYRKCNLALYFNCENCVVKLVSPEPLPKPDLFKAGTHFYCNTKHHDHCY